LPSLPEHAVAEPAACDDAPGSSVAGGVAASGVSPVPGEGDSAGWALGGADGAEAGADEAGAGAEMDADGVAGPVVAGTHAVTTTIITIAVMAMRRVTGGG
jgi:hypothetical protein